MGSKILKSTKGKSLERRLTKLLIGAIIIPTLLLGIIAFTIFNGLSKESFEDNSESLRNALEGLFYSEISSINNSLDALIAVTLESGRGNSTYIKEGLQIIKEGNEAVENIYFLSKENKLINYPEVEVPKDLDLRERVWYKDAYENRDSHRMSDVYEDVISKGKMITISKAVTKNGEFLGVLAVDMNLKSIEDSLIKSNEGSSSEVAIIDREGMLVSYTGTDAWENSFEEFKEAKDGISEYEELGIKYFCSVSNIEGTDWKIIISTPKKVMESGRNKFLILLLISILILVPSGYFISKAIFKKISNAVQVIKDGVKLASSGDLRGNIQVKTGDELEELSEDFNFMKDNIGNLIKRVDGGVKKVDDASIFLSNNIEETSVAMGQVASTVGEISKGINISSDNLVKLTTDMDNVSNEINNISEAVFKMEEVTQNTLLKGEDGLKFVTDVVNKSNEAMKASENVNREVNKVALSVEKISSINETISQITEQTNLLALNAAIEAARAGESGRGFAVVADEIRKLATETSVSAEEIGNIINEIKINVNNTVDEVNESSKIVESQRAGVNKSLNMFNEIISSLNNIGNMGIDISKAVEVMKKNKDNIIESVENSSAILEENAAGTQEVDASCQEIALEAEKIATYVNELREFAIDLKSQIQKFNL